MDKLIEYVMQHSERGACQCGRCMDAPDKPAEHQPEGHTADLVFFKVSATNAPDADELRALIKAHEGTYAQPDLFDGAEHGFMEIGGFIGDQGLALQLMGVGSLLGLWKLYTPMTLGITGAPAMQMAGAGLVTILASKG